MTTNSSSCFMILHDNPVIAMSSDVATEEEFKRKARHEMAKATEPLEKLRLALLLRGTTGIKSFGRLFRIMDDNGSKTLTLEEFEKGCIEQKSGLTPEEVKQLFEEIDKDGSGAIDFNELLISLRPKMSPSRVNLINSAFDKMDSTGDGVITADDMKGVYNARRHPKYISGEKTERQIFELFLASFEIGGHQDGKVTREEFHNYYAGVSAQIDSDVYFDLMMRNAWKL